MTRHELASFALKLLGIYVFIESLPLFEFLGGLLYAWKSVQGEPVTGFWPYSIMVVPLLLVAVAGAVLFIFSRDLAPRLVGEDGPLGTSSVLTGRDVQAIGFSIVAVLIFLRAIPETGQAIWMVLDAFSGRDSEPMSDPFVQHFFRDGIPAAIQLVLAVVLFLQARGLANLWHRIQVGKYVRVAEAGKGPPDRQE